MRWPTYAMIGTFFIVLTGVLLLLSLTHYWDVSAWKVLRVALIGGIFFWIEERKEAHAAASADPESTLAS